VIFYFIIAFFVFIIGIFIGYMIGHEQGYVDCSKDVPYFLDMDWRKKLEYDCRNRKNS